MQPLPNAELADRFAEMADLLELDHGDPHRVRSFRRAAKLIEMLPEQAGVMLRRGDLQKMRGVGEGTVFRVRQLLRTGSCDDLARLRQRVPPGLRELTKLRGLGKTRVRLLHQHLGISSVEELELAARTGRLLTLPRLGERSVEQILTAIADYRRQVARLPLGKALKIGGSLLEQTRALPDVVTAELVGSLRRGVETIGDIDLLAATDDPMATCAHFCTLRGLSEILFRGESMVSARIASGQQVDLWVLPVDQFGAGLHAYSGSQPHVVAIRDRAGRRGLHISEHGVFSRDRSQRLGGSHEEEIFAAVGLPYIPPELRQHSGEIEAAERGALPRLLTRDQLRGDLHMHTTDSDGLADAPRMARAAASLGLEYIAITDHSKALSVANGLDEARLAAQAERVRRLDRKLANLDVLAGVEVDILPDGRLDIDAALLARLDWVVASVHSHFEQSEAQMTERVVRALESGLVDCLGHPRGRRLGKRDPYPLALPEVLAAAKKLDVAVELNCGPMRLDLDAAGCRQAREAGVAVCLNSDAHSPQELAHRDLGVRVARRGWLEAKDVLNTRKVSEIRERRRARLQRSGPLVVSAGPAAERAHATAEPAHATAEPARVEPITAEPAEPARDTAKPAQWLPQPKPVAGSPRSSAGWGTPGDVAEAADVAAQGSATDDDAGAAQLDPLEQALVTRKLDAALRERVEGYLRGDVDHELHAVLARLSQNPLQLAFDILLSAAGGF
jgi:DNA polymerase (family 10)